MNRFTRTLFRVTICVAPFLPSCSVAQTYSSGPVGEYLHYPTAVSTNGSVVAGYDAIVYEAPSQYTAAAGWVDLPDSIGLDTTKPIYGNTTGISNNGHCITGFVFGTLNGASRQYAVYWSYGKEKTIPPPPGDPAPTSMIATGVSGDGSTILVEDSTAGSVHAYVYNNKTKAYTSLGFLGSSVQQTYVTGVSRDGSVVVGYSNLDNGNSDGFEWTAATGMQDIGIPPGHPGTLYVHPACVSGDGSKLFGSYTDGNGWMGFYWSQAGGWNFFNNLSPTACSLDGTQVIGTTDLYFPGLWSERRGEGRLADLLSVHGIPTTVLSLRCRWHLECRELHG